MLEKIKFAGAGVGTLATYLFGGFDDTLIFLIIAMSLDFISGIIKSYNKQTMSSKVGYTGITKKIMIFFVLIIATQLDRVSGVSEPLFRTLVCWFYIANECISIFENCSELGLPVPEKLKDALAQIKDKGDKVHE